MTWRRGGRCRKVTHCWLTSQEGGLRGDEETSGLTRVMIQGTGGLASRLQPPSPSIPSLCIFACKQISGKVSRKSPLWASLSLPNSWTSCTHSYFQHNPGPWQRDEHIALVLSKGKAIKPTTSFGDKHWKQALKKKKILHAPTALSIKSRTLKFLSHMPDVCWILPHVILTAILRSHYCYYTHFTHEKAGLERSIINRKSST